MFHAVARSGFSASACRKLRDGLVGPVRGGKRQAQVVVELRLLRHQRDRPFEKRQRVGEAVALIVDDAQVVQRGRVVRRRRERGAIVAFRGIDVAALMRLHARAQVSSSGVGGAGRRLTAAPAAPWHCL